MRTIRLSAELDLLDSAQTAPPRASVAQFRGRRRRLSPPGGATYPSHPRAAGVLQWLVDALWRTLRLAGVQGARRAELRGGRQVPVPHYLRRHVTHQRHRRP
jgi:hypothetical protein